MDRVALLFALNGFLSLTKRERCFTLKDVKRHIENAKAFATFVFGSVIIIFLIAAFLYGAPADISGGYPY